MAFKFISCHNNVNELCLMQLYLTCDTCEEAVSYLWSKADSTGPVFIKHLKSNVYVTLNAIGSFLCNLCSHWLITIFIT